MTFTSSISASSTVFRKVSASLWRRAAALGWTGLPWQLSVATLDAVVSKFLLPSFGFGFIGDQIVERDNVD